MNFLNIIKVVIKVDNYNVHWIALIRLFVGGNIEFVYGFLKPKYLNLETEFILCG